MLALRGKNGSITSVVDKDPIVISIVCLFYIFTGPKISSDGAEYFSQKDYR